MSIPSGADSTRCRLGFDELFGGRRTWSATGHKIATAGTTPRKEQREAVEDQETAKAVFWFRGGVPACQRQPARPMPGPAVPGWRSLHGTRETQSATIRSISRTTTPVPDDDQDGRQQDQAVDEAIGRSPSVAEIPVGIAYPSTSLSNSRRNRRHAAGVHCRPRHSAVRRSEAWPHAARRPRDLAPEWHRLASPSPRERPKTPPQAPSGCTSGDGDRGRRTCSWQREDRVGAMNV